MRMSLSLPARRLIAALLSRHRRKAAIDESRVSHIFRVADGHFPVDTAANRRLLLRVARDPGSHLGEDRFGVIRAAQTMQDGRQVWAQIRHGRIVNGGVNSTPRSFSPVTGMSFGIGNAHDHEQ